MTVEEKSTAVGEDLALDFYNDCELKKHENNDSTVWKCIVARGYIPYNSELNNYINYCSSDNDETITSSSTDAEIKTSVIDYVNALTWNEPKLPDTVTNEPKV